MSATPLTIGTFGHGCVGQGFLQLLNAHGGAVAQVKHICVKERGRDRDVGTAQLTYEALDILTDSEVQAIVELTNDPALAIAVIRHALTTGRNAITASKKIVAEHLAELIALQRSTGRALLYEAACAASIPVLHTLETHFSGEAVQRIDGILNGTTNYILTKAQEESLSPAEALAQAQAAGFAEADPSSDLSGDDARYKLVLLIAHAFGTLVEPRRVLRHGITALHADDLAFGARHGWTLRSVASAWRNAEGRLAAYVLPTFVPADHPFAHVREEYNAVRIEGAYSGVHLLQGKGAGRLPTGLAVLGDVQRLLCGGGYGYAKVGADAPQLAEGNELLPVYLRLPETHQEALQHFERLHGIETREGQVRATGTIALAELAELLGNGRDDFQVIVLPHLRGSNRNGGE